MGKVDPEGLHGGASHRDQSGLVALSGDPDHTALFVEVLEAHSASLGNPEAAGIKKLQQGAVADFQRGVTGGSGDELLNVTLGERLRECPREARQGEFFGRIGSDVSACGQEAEEDPQGHGLQLDRGGGEAPFFFGDQEVGEKRRSNVFG